MTSVLKEVQRLKCSVMCSLASIYLPAYLPTHLPTLPKNEPLVRTWEVLEINIHITLSYNGSPQIWQLFKLCFVGH